MPPADIFDDAPRVVVVAADPLVRGGLTTLVDEAGADVLGAAPLDAVAPMLDTVPVDLLVVDVVGADEIDLLGTAGVPCIAMVADRGLAQRCIDVAWGIVPRSVSPERLWGAIAAVTQELRVVDPELVPNPPASSGRGGPDLAQAAATSGVVLTDREHEVLGLMGQGLSNREIGLELEISANTAKFHVKAVLDKLGAQTRTEAVVLALRAGLLDL